jgi:beta-galactosidase
VVIWSAGNETKYDCADEETANAKKVCATIKAMDPTRPMTAGLKQIDCAMRSGLMEMLDIAGLNNSPFRYKEAQLKTPQHKVLGTMCNATKEEVEMMKENDWVAGEFVQEDLIQLLSKTDKYYYYRSLWNNKKHTLHLTSHWNHQEGEKVSVRVMTDLKSVELMVNGKSAGKTDSAAWHDISFEKGELKAVGYDDKGKNVMTTYLRTAEEAVHAEVVPEYAGEMTFVEIRIVDAKNTVCPMFEGNVKVQAEGDGQLVAQMKDNELQPIDAKEADIKVSGGKTTIMVSGNMKLTVLPDKLIGAILDINHNK